MPSLRRTRRSYRRGYRRGYRSGYGRYLRRYFRSYKRPPVANASDRSSTIIQLKSCNSIPFSIPPGSQYSQINVCNPVLQNTTAAATKVPTWFNQSIMNTGLWDKYKDLYDQYKILSVGCKITGLDTIGGGGAIGACKVVTYWDRCTRYEDMAAQQAFTPATLVNMPGAKAFTFTNNSKVKLYVSCKASDLQEKITYVDTDQTDGSVSAAYTGLAAPQNFWFTNALNKEASFHPSLYTMVFSPIANGTANAIPVNMMIDMYCTIQLRNPKYTSQAQAKTNKTVTVIPEQQEQPEIIQHEETLMDIESLLDTEKKDT